MDPLSVTLAVVTFATAVKDMVELGQKIHESFAKVSKNLRNAQRVAKEIKEMAEEIEAFYEANKDVLDSMKDFGVALEDLLGKFRSFETSILPLLPRTDRMGPGLFLQGWWNNNKIEGRILDLESVIVKVMRRYMMRGVMRNEVKLERVHQDTNRGFANVQKGMTQGFEVIRRDISALHMPAANTMPHRSYESSLAGTTSDEFNRKIIMIAQSTTSTSAPILRTPTVITEELMTTAYIKFQITGIATTMEKISTLHISISARNSVPFRLSPLVLEHLVMTIGHLRHHVVQQLIGIRDLLETEHIHTISMYDSAIALARLSVGLQVLGMDQECILVGKWTVTLSRTLIDGSGGGQPDLCAALALYLLNQSKSYYGSDHKVQSVQAIKEAYTIAQNLRNHDGAQADIQILYSDILLQYATLLDNQKRSIEMCMEAIQVLEDILNVQAYARPNSPEQIQNVVHHSSSFVDNLFSSAPLETAISSYALALGRLGTYLSTDDNSGNASTLDLQLLAIAVRRKMVSIHGHEHTVDLALNLSSLVHAGSVPTEELIDMADECIQLFRELAQKNPPKYARLLVKVLWKKACALHSLNRTSEAISTWEEVVSLAGQIIQDSELCAAALGNLSDQFRRLERHDDAVRTTTLAINTYHEDTETRALRYFHLSRDLQELRRYKESVEAAWTSVTLYRHLSVADPEKWMGDVTEGLSDLVLCLAASGNHSDALVVWKESVNMLDHFLNANTDATSDVIDRYLAAHHSHTRVSFVLEDQEECLMVSCTAVRCVRQMSEIYPQNANISAQLFWAELVHAYNMFRVGRLHDAQQYIDHLLDVRTKKSEAMSESRIMASHAAMVILKAEVLDGQGCTKQALSVTQNVHNMMLKLPATTHQLTFVQMINSMVHEAGLQVSLGNSEQALQVAEETLQLSRNIEVEPGIGSLVWSLYAVACAALSCRNYACANEAAREGCNILAKSENLNCWQKSGNARLWPSLSALLSSTEANLGRRSTALEYAYRAVNASLDIGNMKLYVPVTTAEYSYIETRGNLADILLYTGNLAQAQEIYKERRAYFSKRAEKRMGDYRELAPILRMLGVLCCSEGHHDEGGTAAQELSRIMKTLGSVFPSLQEQVKIRLRRQAKIPILKVINDLSKKLDCGHQAEILSLFEI